MSNLRNSANRIIKLVEDVESENSKAKRLKLFNLMLDELEKVSPDSNLNFLGSVTKREEKQLVRELHVDSTLLEEALHPEEQEKFYRGNIYAKVANLFFEPITKLIFRTFPAFEKQTHKRLMASGIKLLSLSFISMMLFTSFLLLFLASALGVVLFYSSGSLNGLILGIVLSAVAFLTFYSYPTYLIYRRRKKLNAEFPFLITHLAAIANSRVEGVAIFRTLLRSKYYPCLDVELRRIVNNVTIFGQSLSHSLSSVASQTPSRKVRDFFSEFSEVVENGQNVKDFLNTLSRMNLTQYKLTRSHIFNRFFFIFAETKSVMKQLRFKWIYLFSTITSLGLLLFAFISLRDNSIGFFSLLLLATISGWGLILVDMYAILQKNSQLETQFFWFVRDLKKGGSLLSLEKNYGELDSHVKKLQNQYKLGIPLEKALNTFANDTENPLIRSTVSTVLEAQMYGASIPEALDQITTSKILRNVIRKDKF